MSKQVLITGGAGFIGSHLADDLLRAGYRVRALDNLDPQVHGPEQKRPGYLDPDVELIVGDVRDPDAVQRALTGVDAIFHFAACVGVGQSMYQIARYTDVNNLGTAVVLEALAKSPVERLIVASSMSLYGEGLYRTPGGETVVGAERKLEQLQRHEWEPLSERGERLIPIPTPETKPPVLTSVYALSKYDQERLCLIFGRAYRVPTVALRFFNAYGPRQALGNPYTGVLAIFATSLLNGRAPVIYEDGGQMRDFVSVHDIAHGCRLALEASGAPDGVYNLGSSRPYSVAEIAEKIARLLGREHLAPEITGQYRAGDIRHCYADITLSRAALGYEARVDLEEGIQELAGWLQGQAALERSAEARAELQSRGLTI